LIVEDDAPTGTSMADALDRAGYATRLVGSGEAALEAVREELPALVLLDVCLPGLSGYQVCHELRNEFGSGLPIVFVSGARRESYDRVAGLLIGGDDYLVKPVAPDELLIRVERLVRRAVALNPAVTAQLTSRELEIVRLLAEGMSSREIAERLFISPKTVSTHIDRILVKLGVHSRAQLIAVAHRRELLAAPS
jgi:DNA-binding NarL/FixJ family response regulator